MANLPENAVYEAGIFQLEKTTPPLGGVPVFNGNNPSDGHANVQALQLANRTAYLKVVTDDLDQRLTEIVAVAAGIYPTTEAGIAATSDGTYFNVPSDDPNDYIILYQNAGGTAVEISRAPSSGRVTAIDDDLQQTKDQVSTLQQDVTTSQTDITNLNTSLGLVEADVITLEASLVTTNNTVSGINTDLQESKVLLQANIDELRTDTEDEFYRTSNKLVGGGDLVLDSQSGQSIASLSLNNPAAAVWISGDEDILIADTQGNKLSLNFDLVRKVDVLDVKEGHSDKREYPEFQTLSDNQAALALGTMSGDIAFQIDTVNKNITTSFTFNSSVEQRPPTVFVDVPPRIERNTSNPLYTRTGRVYQATPTIERTGATRYWQAWRADNTNAAEVPGNFAVLAYSDTNNTSLVEYGYLTYNPGGPDKHMVDPMLWLDPAGRLWLFFGCMGNNKGFDGVQGTWAIICQNPNAQFPVWGQAFRLSYYGDPRHPVQVNGQWYIALDGWRHSASSPLRYMSAAGPHIHKLDWQNQKLEHISQLPPNNGSSYSGFFETEFLQRQDGSVIALCRSISSSAETRYCISNDLMKTWSDWVDYTVIAPSSSSRMWLGRSPSGRTVFCWNNDLVRKTLTLGLSDDDGTTYPYKVILEPDATGQVSYPVVTFGDSGAIYIIYDNERTSGKRQIRIAKVVESEVVAGTSVPVVSIVSNPFA